MLEGICEQKLVLKLVRSFVVVEDDGGGKLAKKMAGHNQFRVVETAMLDDAAT